MKKNLSKILSIVLCLVLLGATCISAAALEIGGSGTKNNPYLISTKEELKAFADAVNAGDGFSGKFFRLESDITVDDSFLPIGSTDLPFEGSFDGNGKTVSGFNVNKSYAGLFGYTRGAVIANVTVEGKFTAETYAGGIVAYAEDTVIENCVSEAGVYAVAYAGGIAGAITSGKITGCATTSDAIVVGYAKDCGGIAGYSAAEIRDCVNRTYVNGSGAQNTGGIAGTSKGDIISCTNTTTVSATKSNVGGIAGVSEGNIRYCKNTGTINTRTSSVGKAGGIAGAAAGVTIEECHNGGEISMTGSYVGGIAGYVSDTSIRNCITTANVSTTGSYAGGIFGLAVDGKVSLCLMTAAASSGTSLAAGIGALSQAEITDCYYNLANGAATLSGAATGTEGISAAAFTTASSLSKLDFVKVWTMNSLHASYPLLQSVPFHTVSVTSFEDASCTTDGKETGTCTLCFEKLETIIPATGHTYSVLSSKNPTCTENGYKDLLCTVCGSNDTELLEAKGHTDADADSRCDTCAASLKAEEKPAEKTLLQKIGDFFRSILDWIKNLFVR